MNIHTVIAGIIKRMLSNENSIGRLQICLVVIVSMTVPPVFVYTTLYPAVSPIPKEGVSVCKAYQMQLKSVNTENSGIYKIDDAENTWIALPNVSTAIDVNSYVEGSASMRMNIEDEFKTGQVAVKNLVDYYNTFDLNNFDCITFWIKSSNELDDDTLQLRFIDSDSGNMTYGSIGIPGSALDGKEWNKVSINLPDTIIDSNFNKSIALYAVKDPGVVTIWLDIIETHSSSLIEDYTESYLNELVYSKNNGEIFAG